MEDVQKRIRDIEKEMAETPYHKGTEHYIGLLRSRLAKLKDQVLESAAKKGGGGGGFAVKKHGDATVVLVGFPSVGKSTLLNKLTNANSPAAEYAFTTVTVIPGMMKYKGADIQILDVPGLIEGAAAGRGKGREVLSVVRGADLLLILAPAGSLGDFDKIKNELYLNGVRMNQKPPEVFIKKTSIGGMKINSSVRQELDRKTIEDICKEFRLVNAEVGIREIVSIDRLIDAFATNRVFVPAIDVITKADLVPKHYNNIYNHSAGYVIVSSTKNTWLDILKEAIWTKLGLTRIYLKRPGEKVDRADPMIMFRGQTLKDILDKISTELSEGKKQAKIWGPIAHFPGQTVSLSLQVQDEMEVMFV